MDWLWVAGGLIVLILAGDSLVRGAVNLALRLGIPALIVSLTVVAFGTSAPELLVSVAAVIDGVPGLALGNVVGSNIANILLILGLPAIIATVRSSQIDTRAAFLQMLGATALVIALALMGGLGPIKGLILIAALAVILVMTAKRSMDARDTAPPEGADPDMPGWKIGAFLAFGFVGLPIGAHFLVLGATNIALAFGVSETVIGLTLVAVGTSLPELATSIAAAFRRQADVIMGNVIGSNFFNLLGILGVASLFGHIPVEQRFAWFDFPVLAGVTLLVLPFALWKWDITRGIGALFVALYVAFTLAVLAV